MTAKDQNPTLPTPRAWHLTAYFRIFGNHSVDLRQHNRSEPLAFTQNPLFTLHRKSMEDIMFTRTLWFLVLSLVPALAVIARDSKDTKIFPYQINQVTRSEEHTSEL